MPRCGRGSRRPVWGLSHGPKAKYVVGDARGLARDSGLKERALPGAAPIPPYPYASADGRSLPLSPPKSWGWKTLWQWRVVCPTDFGGTAAEREATDGDGDGKGSRGTQATVRLAANSPRKSSFTMRDDSEQAASLGRSPEPRSVGRRASSIFDISRRCASSRSSTRGLTTNGSRVLVPVFGPRCPERSGVPNRRDDVTMDASGRAPPSAS